MADTDHLNQLDPATTTVLLEDAPIMACSPRVAGKLFKINQYHVSLACQRGEIQKHACGRKVVILVSDLEAWVRKQPPAKSPAKSVAPAPAPAKTPPAAKSKPKSK